MRLRRRSDSPLLIRSKEIKVAITNATKRDRMTV
jgi:hypothetical protein